MATVADVVRRIRTKIRDTRSTAFTDQEVMDVMNGVIALVHQLLSNIQSSLAYRGVTFTTTAGVREIQLPGVQSPLPDIGGVYVDDVLLEQIFPHDLATLGDDGSEQGKPIRYYLTAPVSGVSRIGFSPTPDAVYSGIAYLKSALTPLTAVDSTPMPFGGVWDAYIEAQTAVELEEILEGDVSYLMAKAHAAYIQALNETYRRGVRRFTPQPTTKFFLPKGV